MGLRQRMELNNTQRVVHAIEYLEPAFEPVAYDVPCHIVPEQHAGIRMWLPHGGAVFVFRCQLKWWARTISRDNLGDLEGVLSNYKLATT